MLPDGTVLREGSDYWTCFPYIGENVNSGPVCADPIWAAAMHSELVDGHYAVEETCCNHGAVHYIPAILRGHLSPASKRA